MGFKIKKKKMILSMTGFGKSTCELPNKKIHIEIKSLNSKQLDLNIKVPNIYREKELELRNLVAGKLLRGKIEVSFTVESMIPDRVTQLNQQVIENYHTQLIELSNKLNITNSSDLLRTILSLPDVLKAEQAELNLDEWKQIMLHTAQAADALQEFRTQEGATLQGDIAERTANIAQLLKEVEPFEKVRIDKIKERIRESLSEVVDPSKIDENRFEQELIFYVEKLDITEEKVRLAHHINYFNETMNENEPVGKKLGFITQEMGREINTLGSKANDSDMQKLVIQMKDELEKIKEQILNVL